MKPLTIAILLLSTAASAGQPDIEDRRENDTSMQIPFTEEQYRIKRVFIRKDTLPANDETQIRWVTVTDPNCPFGCLPPPRPGYLK